MFEYMMNLTAPEIGNVLFTILASLFGLVILGGLWIYFSMKKLPNNQRHKLVLILALIILPLWGLTHQAKKIIFQMERYSKNELQELFLDGDFNLYRTTNGNYREKDAPVELFEFREDEGILLGKYLCSGSFRECVQEIKKDPEYATKTLHPKIIRETSN